MKPNDMESPSWPLALFAHTPVPEESESERERRPPIQVFEFHRVSTGRFPAGHFHEQVARARAGAMEWKKEERERGGGVSGAGLTEVGDARGLGLDVVGDAEEGADLGDERLRDLLAVELVLLRGHRRGRRRAGLPRAQDARAARRPAHHPRRRRRRRRLAPLLLRDVAKRAAGRAHLLDLDLHASFARRRGSGGGEHCGSSKSVIATARLFYRSPRLWLSPFRFCLRPPCFLIRAAEREGSSKWRGQRREHGFLNVASGPAALLGPLLQSVGAVR
jgi:hypothetical protein